jgi:hypothetical protein
MISKALHDARHFLDSRAEALSDALADVYGQDLADDIVCGFVQLVASAIHGGGEGELGRFARRAIGVKFVADTLRREVLEWHAASGPLGRPETSDPSDVANAIFELA